MFLRHDERVQSHMRNPGAMAPAAVSASFAVAREHQSVSVWQLRTTSQCPKDKAVARASSASHVCPYAETVTKTGPSGSQTSRCARRWRSAPVRGILR